MRILYLCADSGIDLTGPSGGAIHIRAFVRALHELGHKVTVVCSTVSSPETAEKELGAAVRPAFPARWNHAVSRALRSVSRLANSESRLHRDAGRMLHNLTFGRVAKMAAREFAPDFVYERYSLWGFAGSRLAKILCTPLVLEINAPLVEEQMKYRGLSFPALARRIERRVWRSADLTILVSEPLRRHLELSGVPPDCVRVVPNGVDPWLFHPDVDGGPVREHLKLGGRFVVGFVGTFKPWHGLDVLLAAFRELYQEDSTSSLLLVGDGPLRSSLEEAVRQAGLTAAVTFTGNVPHREMPAYLAAMDVAVAPYPPLEDLYFSPLKLFEYMASGRAIVASRAGQIAQVLEDGVTGLLFEPGNGSELLARLRRLKNDVTLRHELGSRAGAAGRSLSWSSNAARVVSWVETLPRRESVLPRFREKEQHLA
ncbi:MAG: glycosyltransferase family 4 protein [Acidobacteria bacterium]|nr:glycosyltransferase family 4 protein [Acidobacteriota bacterium]MBI3662680.1 glycosyltransferase family 4 protein [Acidobacteriota bacterium]